MSTRYYQASGLDVARMAHDVEQIFMMQGYQVQHFNEHGRMIIQFRQGGDFEALLGLQAAVTIILQHASGGVVAMLGEQKWIDKAAVGILGMILFFPLALTAGAGVLRQAELEGQVFEALDTVALQQRSDVHMGPVPPHMEQQMQQQAPPHFAQDVPPAPHAHPQDGPSSAQAGSGPIPMPGHGQKLCPRCQTAIDADDAFCSRCGTSLKPQKRYCAHCKAELKPDAVFCSRCGASVDQPAGHQ